MMKPIHDLFGEKIKIILSTRHPKPSMISFAKVFKSVGPGDSNDNEDFWLTCFGLPYDVKFRPIYEKYRTNWKSTTDGETIALGYGVVLACYFQHKNIYTATVMYEEMTKNIECGTKKLFDKLNIPEKYVLKALTALQQHSQNNVLGSSDMNSEDLLTKEDWKRADEIFQELEIPINNSMTVEELSKLVH